jgi:hypothetical protein
VATELPALLLPRRRRRGRRRRGASVSHSVG